MLHDREKIQDLMSTFFLPRWPEYLEYKTPSNPRHTVLFI